MKKKSIVDQSKCRIIKTRQELTLNGYTLSYDEKMRLSGKKRITTNKIEKVSEGYFRFIKK